MMRSPIHSCREEMKVFGWHLARDDAATSGVTTGIKKEEWLRSASLLWRWSRRTQLLAKEVVQHCCTALNCLAS